MTTANPLRSADDLLVGSALDRYDVIRLVARGGMGSVWLGRLTGKHGFEKLVAIKTVRADLANLGNFRAMFLDEARITARLSHPNIAQVLDVGEREGTFYIVFEWVEGRSLEAVCADAAVRGEPLALGFVLSAIADTCAGLHAAHQLSDGDGTPLAVVHRDVSPQNVMVSTSGGIKLIDFGVAKARDRIAPETRSGIVKGTPQYMAPEQALGKTVDCRADVWAAGGTLYRALAGVPPFADREALAEFLGGTPLPRVPHLPELVTEVMLRALQRDPRDRYPTADEMRLALERALHWVRAEGDRPSFLTARADAAQTATVLEPRIVVPATNQAATQLETRLSPASQPAPARSAGATAQVRAAANRTNKLLAAGLGLAALSAIGAALVASCSG